MSEKEKQFECSEKESLACPICNMIVTTNHIGERCPRCNTPILPKVCKDCKNICK